MRLGPRWRKAVRDLAVHPARTMLAVMALAVGSFGPGTVLTAYAILQREVASTWTATRPSSATLGVDRADAAALALVRGTPGVVVAESRAALRGRALVGEGRWVPLVLFVVSDFDGQALDRFSRDAGAWPPGPDDVLLERSAVGVAGSGIGSSLTVRLARGDRAVRIAGTVHAGGLAPAWMDHVVTGFMAPDSTLLQSGTPQPAIRLVVDNLAAGEAHSRDVAEAAKARLEAAGYHVGSVDIATGRHPHADQMDTFTFLLGAFGVLAAVLGAVLVATLVHNVLVREVTQVGVMKAIGASSGQVAAIYLAQVGILALGGLAVSAPLAWSAGHGYANLAASILNLADMSAHVPGWVMLAQLGIALVVPLAVALGPIAAASGMSVREALAGANGGTSRRFPSEQAWWVDTRLPRPLLLSVRTLVRRPIRLALTIGMLAIGGGVFLGALNVSSAWTFVLDRDDAGHRDDLKVVLARATPRDEVRRVLDQLPGVTRVEYWAETGASVRGQAASPHGTTSFIGPPSDSMMVALPLLGGRWLASGEEGSVVVNQVLAALAPCAGVGGTIDITVRGRTVSRRVVGVVEELGAGPGIYGTYADVVSAVGLGPEQVRVARLQVTPADVPAQRAAQHAVEQAFEQAGIDVAGVSSRGDRRQAFEDHLLIVKTALMFAALLTVIVGVLGVGSALSVSVLERTREFGVLMAIGGRPAELARFVVFEGALLGGASWAFALVLAVPITMVIERVAGAMFLRAPLPFVVSPEAAVVWFVFVVLLSAAAALVPARRVVHLEVREALGYE